MKKLSTFKTGGGKALLMLLLLGVSGLTRGYAQQSLPYSYGFENGDEGQALTEGWTKQLQTGNTYCYVAAGNAIHDGSKGFQFADYTSLTNYKQNNYLISPELNAPNGVAVSFWYKNFNSSTYGKGTYNVGYSTTDTEVASFTWLSPYNTTATTNGWKKTEAFLCPPGTKYVAIRCSVERGDEEAGWAYFFIDDVSFTEPVVQSITSGYNYGFENYDPAADGWMTLNRNGGSYTIGGAAKRTGDYGYQMLYGSATSGQYLISPRLDLNSNTGVKVEFYYSIYSAGTQNFQVGYSTTGAKTTDFTFGATIAATNVYNGEGWLKYEVIFPTNTKYVAVKSLGTYYLFLDDFSFTVAPDAAAKSLAYRFGFEADQDFNGWTMTDYYYGGSTYANTGIVGGGAVHSGSKGFEFYGAAASASYQYLITPELSNSTANEVGVDFYYKAYSGSHTFYVGYSTTTKDLASFTWGSAITTTSTDWIRYMNTFDKDTKYVALKYAKPASASYLFVDDLCFSETVTINKDITGYGSGTGNWYLIAPPVEAVAATSVASGNYDLYSFDQSQDMEWVNYKAHTSTFTTLNSGVGYLYAHKEGITLNFKGQAYTGDGKVKLTKTDAVDCSGWNLVGNPYNANATIDKDYYRMNGTGTGFIATDMGNAVNAMEGVFVYTDTDGATLNFTSAKGNSAHNNQLVINVCNSGSDVAIDRAIVRFNGNSTLSKLRLMDSGAEIYIPQNGMDYAIATAAITGEIPLKFRATRNGNYTLRVATEYVEMGSLRLIDNFTGTSIDLKANPSYSFSATAQDNPNRFRLVFDVTDVNEYSENASFAYFNGSEWVVNASDNASVQVVDVTGRIVLSTDATRHISTSSMAPGMYVIRLTEGDNVKTQKIVVK